MTWEPILDETIELLTQLRDQERTLRSRWSVWRRGGLPSSSLRGDSPRSSETPLPLPDRVDQQIARDRDAIGRLILEIRADTRMVAGRAFYWLRSAPPLPDPILQACGNTPCSNVPGTDPTKPNDRLRPAPANIDFDGWLCDRCRHHAQRYGMLWPKKPGDT